MRPQDIAKICHEANRAYCEVHGDHSQVAWEQAPAWQRESAERGVVFALENPRAMPSDQNEFWLQDKLAAGRVYGDVKDAERKTHPWCVPYGELPAAERAKDALFVGIVRAMAAAD